MNNDRFPSEKRIPLISLMAFTKLMLRRWPIFLISIILFSGVLFVIGKRMVVGTTEYKIGLMTRFSEEREARNSVIKTKEEPLWKKAPAYGPSQIYGWLVSADIIYRAGMKVGFDVDYTQRNLWGRFDVYDNMPIRLFFLDAKDMDEFSMDMLFKDGKATLSNFSGFYRGNLIKQPEEVQIETVEQIVETPFGRVMMKNNPGWDEYLPTPIDLSKKVHINRIKAIDARAKYDWGMKLEVKHESVFDLKVKTTGSQRRSLQILEQMLVECNDWVRRHLLEDLNKEQEILQAALESLSDPNSAASQLISSEVRAQKCKDLEERLAQNIANKGVSLYEDMIEVTDPPVLFPAPSGLFYVKVVLYLLSLLVPMLIIYFVWFYRGAILEREQLSSFWTKSLLPTLKGPKNSASLSILDNLSYALSQDLCCEDRNREYHMLPPSTILFTAPSFSKDSTYWVNALAESMIASGRKIRLVELASSEDKRVCPNAQLVLLKKGYLGTEEFRKEIAPTQEETLQNVVTLLITPSDKAPILVQDAASMVVLLISEQTEMKRIQTLEEELIRCTKNSMSPLHTLWIEKPLFL